jgi:lyso-ornithine lipid O-acyltransferase
MLLWRLLFFIGYTTKIVLEIRLKSLIYGVDLSRAMRIRRKWANRLLKGVGVIVEVQGKPPDFPCLVVANHRSYLDPILMLCEIDGFPVAKAELASWPIIGKGARDAGILYVKRENTNSRLSTMRLIAEKIQEGHPVIIFPEGTTSDLAGTLPFKKGAFLMAARSKIPVVPVALVFKDPRDFWIGKVSFLAHASRRFREKNIYVTLHYGKPIHSDDTDVLIEKSKAFIDPILQGSLQAVS